MSIKLDMLRVFAAVAETGNLARAAERLGRTPSAVSMMLKQFEEEIGAALFETARKSRLTPLGEVIQAEARAALAAHDQSLAAIKGYAQAQTGHLRVAATPSLATGILPDIIGPFLAAHPDLTLDLRDMDSAGVLEAVARDQADLGLATAPAGHPLIRRHLFSDPFGLVCRADHSLTRNWDDLRWPDLVGVSFIANGLCHLVTDAEFAPVLASARLNVPSTASLLGLVRAGVGVTVLPRLAVPEGAGDLAFLRLRDARAVREVHLIAGARRVQLPAVQALLAAIEAVDFGVKLQLV